MPATSRAASHYWLAWERPRAGTIVTAELDREANAVHLAATGDVAGLEVLLDGELLELDKREVVITLDGDEVYRGQPERRLDVLLRTGARGDEAAIYAAAIRL